MIQVQTDYYKNSALRALNIKVKQKIKSIGFLLLVIVNFCAAQDEFFLGDESTFTQYVDNISNYDGFDLTDLSPDKFIIAYDEYGIPGRSSVKVGMVDADCGVIFGEPENFASDIYQVSIEKISESKFIIIYDLLTAQLFLRVGEIDDENQITLGEPFQLDDNSVDRFSIKAFGDNQFVIAYIEHPTGGGRCRIGSYNEDLSIEVSSGLYFSSVSLDQNYFFAVEVLSNSRFVIAYGAFGGYCKLGTIEDNEIISISDSFDFNALSGDFSSVNNISLIALDESSFILNYIKRGSLNSYNRGISQFCQIDVNEEITFSEEFDFGTNRLGSLRSKKMTETTYALTFWDYSTDEGQVLVGVYENNEITFGQETIITPDLASNTSIPIGVLSEELIVLPYEDGPSHEGRVVLASEIELTSCLTSASDIKSPSFSVFPNPTSSLLNIINDNPSEYDVRIFGIAGRTLIQKKGCHGNTIIDLELLESGLYMVSIVSGNFEKVEKIVVR